ncbi:MAG: DUF423 domain-containing protein [Bacteroidia bacterium]
MNKDALSSKKLVTIGILGALAVMLGAMGAHYLKNKMQSGLITPDQLEGFEKGVKYHMYHTIGMMLILLFNKEWPSKYFEWAWSFFFWGIILFSGSLYFLCTRNLFGAEWLKALGPVTPIGGLCFIAGWLLLIPAALKKDKSPEK